MQRLSLLNKISLDQSHAKHVGYPAKHYINQRRSLLQQHPKIKVVDFNLPFDIIKDIVLSSTDYLDVSMFINYIIIRLHIRLNPRA